MITELDTIGHAELFVSPYTAVYEKQMRNKTLAHSMEVWNCSNPAPPRGLTWARTPEYLSDCGIETLSMAWWASSASLSESGTFVMSTIITSFLMLLLNSIIWLSSTTTTTVFQCNTNISSQTLRTVRISPWKGNVILICKRGLELQVTTTSVISTTLLMKVNLRTKHWDVTT